MLSRRNARVFGKFKKNKMYDKIKGMSTQNRNSYSDYLCEQQSNKKMLEYQTLPSYGYIRDDNKYFFSLGSVPQASREHLSYNAVDTESFLRNIGSTNLVQPNKKINPRDKASKLRDGLFYDIQPTVMPHSLTIFKNQRPGPM